MANDRYTVPSLDRAIRVLDLLAREKEGLNLAELTRRTEIPKSTLFRILSTLLSRGCLHLEEESKKYRLGLKLWELGSAYIEQSDLDSVAVAYMKALVDACGETVFLGVLDESEVVYTRRIESPDTVTVIRKSGHRTPAYCTATGRAMLAFMGEEQRKRLLDRVELIAHTPKTTTDRAELSRQMTQIRDEGVAVVDGEYNPQLLCVSAPVLEGAGRVQAAVTVAMLSAEANARRVEDIKDQVQQQALGLSRELGYLGEQRSEFGELAPSVTGG